MKNIEKYKEEIKNAFIEQTAIGCATKKSREGNCNDELDCNTCCLKSFNWLLEEYKEPIKPILTEKEKAYLKNMIEPYGNNTAYVCRFITETLREEFLSICINVDENNINSFEIPLIHGLKTWYKNMVLDKEYTLEELGL